jgi:hypothetical protein
MRPKTPSGNPYVQHQSFPTPDGVVASKNVCDAIMNMGQKTLLIL